MRFLNRTRLMVNVRTRTCYDVAVRYAFVMILCACGSAPRTAASWASTEMGCPREGIEVEWITGQIYEVTGCGQRALYFCPNRHACERRGTAFRVQRHDSTDADSIHLGWPERGTGLTRPEPDSGGSSDWRPRTRVARAK